VLNPDSARVVPPPDREAAHLQRTLVVELLDGRARGIRPVLRFEA
jgi:hypothetical protein